MRFQRSFPIYATRIMGFVLALALSTNCLPLIGHASNPRHSVARTSATTGSERASHPEPAPDLLNHKNTTGTAERTKTAKKQISDTYGRLPLRFEVNKGQDDPQVKFSSRGAGYGLYLTLDEAVMVLSAPPSSVASQGDEDGQVLSKSKQTASSDVIRMKLSGANPRPRMSGLDELPGKSNYYIGNNPRKWKTNVSSYAKVKYERIYPGIDAIYYGNQRQLEYDFVVAPGANTDAIKMGFEGAKQLAIDANGDLVLTFDRGQNQATQAVCLSGP